MNKKQRMHELVERLNKANKAYYEEGKSLMSDVQYDTDLKELKSLEKDLGIVVAESPTKKLGDSATSSSRYKHEEPMLSIDNVYTLQGVLDWYKKLGDVELLISPKIDGMAMRVIPGNKPLCVTRGDGEYGDIITENALAIGIPKTTYMTLGGECYISNEDFKSINTAGEYKNPRNLTTGTMKCHDPKKVVDRKVSFVVHTVSSDKHDSCSDALHAAKELGFNVVEFKTVVGATELADALKKLESEYSKFKYPCDGLVIRVNSLTISKELGHTSKHYNWAIAYKFMKNYVETTLKDVEWTTGRTGKLTPNAVLEPVEINGTTVSAASLHNWSFVSDLTKGAVVRIEKAGEIIPQIVDVVSHGKTKFAKPNSCPVCSGPVLYDDVNIFCTNDVCKSKTSSLLEYAVGRGQLDIKGLGPKNLELLDITDPVDLFNTAKVVQALMKAGKPGVAANVSEQIEKAKKACFCNTLVAFGAKGVGHDTCKKLCKSGIVKAEYLRSITDEQLNRIGLPVENLTGQRVKSFLTSDRFKLALVELSKQGVNLEFTCNEKVETMKTNDSFWQGKNVVITGTFSKPRAELQTALARVGAIIQSSVNSKTHVLLVGEDPGSKVAKAKSFDIKFINEKSKEFAALSI